MKSDNKSLLKTLTEIVPQYFVFLIDYGFKLIENKVWNEYFYDATYQKDDLYIRIDANIHPRDYPMCFNILLGQGDTKWPDTDWNSTALWRVAKRIDENGKIKEYELGYDINYLNGLMQKAKADLIRYNGGFLEGNLEIFHEARKIMNKDREPYKIHRPNKNGTYSWQYDKESAKLKKKYDA